MKKVTNVMVWFTMAVLVGGLIMMSYGCVSTKSGCSQKLANKPHKMGKYYKN